MPSVAVNPPKTPVTKGSNGIAMATVPNVCKMPGPPAPFVPTPLPNIGKSGSSPDKYTKDVKVEKKTVAIKGASFGSQGDIASKGTGGGLISSNTHGPTKFIGPGSLDVKFEGKNVQLLGDPMMNNCGPSGSPSNSATLAGTVQLIVVPAPGSPDTCPVCKEASGKNKSDGKPYEDFFDAQERAELDAIAAKNPDLLAMLPPTNGIYKVIPSAKARRDKYEKLKKKAELKGEYHHPHPIKTGGCAIHQPVVKKPSAGPEKGRVDSVDEAIQAVVNRAIVRNSG